MARFSLRFGLSSSVFGALLAATCMTGSSLACAQRGASTMVPQARAPRFLPPMAMAGPSSVAVRRSPHLTFQPGFGSAERRPQAFVRRAPLMQRQTHFVSPNRHSRRFAVLRSRFGFPANDFFPAPFAFWPWWGWDWGSPNNCSTYDGSGKCYDQQDYGSHPAEASEDMQRPMIIVYLRDGSGYGALDYWVTNGTLHIATTYGVHKTFPMEQVDLERTGKENAQRGVNFTFYTYPMISDPGPVLAPDSYAPACPAQTMPAPPAESASTGNGLASFGATGTASEKGLVVNTVQAGSSAAQAGLQAGDVLVQVDCQPIHQAADMENAFASSNGPVWVSYLIQGAWLTDKKVSR